MAIDPMSPTPLYQQLADLLAARIESGEWPPLMPLPSELTLQQEHGLSRVTVRHAMRVLRERGLIVTIPQRRSYVADQSN